MISHVSSWCFRWGLFREKKLQFMQRFIVKLINHATVSLKRRRTGFIASIYLIKWHKGKCQNTFLRSQSWSKTWRRFLSKHCLLDTYISVHIFRYCCHLTFFSLCWIIWALSLSLYYRLFTKMGWVKYKLAFIRSRTHNFFYLKFFCVTSDYEDK